MILIIMITIDNLSSVLKTGFKLFQNYQSLDIKDMFFTDLYKTFIKLIKKIFKQEYLQIKNTFFHLYGFAIAW